MLLARTSDSRSALPAVMAEIDRLLCSLTPRPDE
jgi:hypothetical protein